MARLVWQANLVSLDAYGGAAIALAARYGRTDLLRKFLVGANSSEHHNYFPALKAAAQHGQAESVAILLKARNQTLILEKSRILMDLACGNPSLETVQALYASPSFSASRSDLSFAVQSDSLDILRFVTNKQENVPWLTLLQITTYRGNDVLIRFILTSHNYTDTETPYLKGLVDLAA